MQKNGIMRQWTITKSCYYSLTLRGDKCQRVFLRAGTPSNKVRANKRKGCQCDAVSNGIVATSCDTTAGEVIN